jgi:hypothetical protein
VVQAGAWSIKLQRLAVQSQARWQAELQGVISDRLMEDNAPYAVSTEGDVNTAAPLENPFKGDILLIGA